MIVEKSSANILKNYQCYIIDKILYSILLLLVILNYKIKEIRKVI